MGPLDGVVLGLYCIAMVALAIAVGRRQTTRADYYLAGRSIPAWQIACSMLATQISAVSLVGGPAFIAAKPNGGLIWLQYEFAVPLAMIPILVLLVPAYRAAGTTTIYEFLEQRFGVVARTSLSAVFIVTRGLATGVILWTTALLVAVPLGWNVYATAVLLGGLALLYTTIGGIKADILTDIVQLVILWIGTLICIVAIGEYSLVGVPGERLQIIDPNHTGVGDGATFAALPMMLGGFFLYVSYYGCDQSQTQRLLTAPDVRTAQRALLWNGLFRFPLALTYCAFGVLLAGYLARNPGFAAQLRDPNELVPRFLLLRVPDGLRGLIIAGVLAAAMSSLDSAFNSLSAATMEDFLRRFSRRIRSLDDRRSLLWSRALTFIWGALCTGAAFLTPRLAPTVIEAINKIGSVVYGPILGVFILATASKRATEAGAVVGLAVGLATNLVLWLVVGDAVSWLWWNAAGFLTCVAVGRLLFAGPPRVISQTDSIGTARMVGALALAPIVIVALCAFLQMQLNAWTAK